MLQRRTYQQQRRDKLRTDVASHVQRTAKQRLTLDEQGRKTLLAHVADVGTQTAQGIHQHTYRAVLHALCSRQHVFLTGTYRQQGRHKTHGRTTSLDIDFIRIVAQRTNHHSRVVTVRQVLGHHAPTRQRMNHQRTVRYTLRCRQLGRMTQLTRSRNCILHFNKLR